MNPTEPARIDQPDLGASARSRRFDNPDAHAASVAAAEWLPVSARGLQPSMRAKIEPHVRAAVASADPGTVSDAHRMLRAGFAITTWAFRELGTVAVETVYHPHNVALFVTEANRHQSAAWQHESRRALTQIGRAANPRFWPQEPKKLGSVGPSASYSATEQDALKLAAVLVGETGRAAEVAVTGLSLGAGLSAPDIAAAMPTDVVSLGGGRVGVQVTGTHCRLVPIRADFTELVMRAVEFAGDERFVRARSRNAAYIAAERVRVVGFGHLRLKRARSTWLQAHLIAGTPLAALRAIAGPLSMNTLNGLLGPASEAFTAEAAAAEGLRA